MNADTRIPVTVLTGFLGSGKTTLLNRLLRSPALADTAVIINEFGSVGIDHLLVEHVAENMRLLASGCLCCTVRGDLVDTLGTLHVRRVAGAAAYSRVVIETTGLADPAPVLHTLMADPALTPHFRLDAVVTTVDAVNGEATLRRYEEAVKQVAVADRLLLTKTDLADAATAERLGVVLRRLNPQARLLPVVQGEVAIAEVLNLASAPPDLGLEIVGDAEADEAVEQAGHAAHHAHRHDPNRHDAHVRSHAFVFEQPVAEADFVHWLALMAAMRGEQMLRVKGLVQTRERPDEPFVVHGVQHVFHPPQRLPAWPSPDRRSRLVFIVRDLPRADIARTFSRFVQPLEENLP